jgi:hypothetical protein
MGIMKYGIATGNGMGHRCTEVWSNQYGKWILLDGQNNAWWESNGIPLNADECRNFLVNNREAEIDFVGQHKEVDYAALKGSWIGYFYHVWFPFDNQFWGNTKIAGERNAEYIAGGISPELFSNRWALNLFVIDDHNRAYPPLNQTNIRFKLNTSTASDTVNVIIAHSMPFFDKFLVRLNGTEWKEEKETFQWVLSKGENIIEAKAINLAGVEGNTSRIVLRNNIAWKP